MNKLKRTKKDSGIALLFALGLLSLLLVLGLGFFTTVTINQKIAVNTNSAAQAKLLGQSAISRALIDLMIYQNDVFNNPNYSPSNFESIFSKGEKEQVGNEIKVGYKVNNGIEDDIITSNDFLLGKKSLLEYIYISELDRLNKTKDNLDNREKNEIAKEINFWNDNLEMISKLNKRKKIIDFPQWIYFYDRDKNNANKKIIGRAAYKVLSDTTTDGKINITSYLSEPLEYELAEVDKNELTPWVKKNNNNFEVYKPEEFRWGKEIDELDINQTIFNDDLYPNGWGTRAKLNDTIIDTTGVFGKALKNALNAFGIPTTDTASVEDKAKFEWAQKWFTEPAIKDGIVLPISNETFYGNSKKFPFMKRFNIGYIANVIPSNNLVDNPAAKSFDNWYYRFGYSNTKASTFLEIPTDNVPLNPDRHQNEKWNNFSIVNRIGSKAESFSENDDIDGTITDSGSGLHFIRQISDDKGSFPSIELRRKQIAANLNDYCDFDNIPTSAKGDNGNAVLSATQWEVDSDSSNVPVYTGNEQTPYINEVAIGLKFKDAKIDNDSIKIKIDTKLFVELVNIYAKKRVIDGSFPFFGKYTFIGNIKKLVAKFKVNLHGDIQYNLDGETTTLNFNDIVDKKEKLISSDCLIVAKKTTPSSVVEADPKKFKIQFSISPEVDNGYYTNVSEINSNQDITLVNLKDLLPDNAQISKINISQIDIILHEYTLSLGNMMLLGNELNNNNSSNWKASPENPGVDYISVRYNSGEEIKQSTETTLVQIEVDDNNFKIPNNYDFTTLCDFSVRDPRQNLNLFIKDNLNDDEVKLSDWSLTLLPQNYNKNDDSDAIKSKTIHTLGDNAKWNISSQIDGDNGHVNKCSDPSSPADYVKKNTFPYNFDKELVTDVAWKGPAKNQHLSTAFIRNAPMWSPWELGAIHRGAAWETINIKIAKPINSSEDYLTADDMNVDANWNDSKGTKYEDGDGAILEQIKMTNDSKSHGKINISKLWEYAVGYTSFDNPDKNKPDDKNILRALFNGMQIGGGYPTKENAKSTLGPTTITLSNSSIDRFFQFNEKLKNGNLRTVQKLRTDVLNWEINNGYWYNAFGNVEDNILQTDADQEEIIGRTINLLTCTPSLPNTIKLLLVAQTIKDIGTETGVKIIKFSKKYNEPAEILCKSGQFDYAYITEKGHIKTQDDYETMIKEKFNENYEKSRPWDEDITYFDEITGEVKMLVTIVRDPLTGTLTVRNIEYLE